MKDVPDLDMYDIARFFSKVTVQNSRTDCWLWKGEMSISEMGYGLFSRGGVRTGAHRISYELFHGPIPDGLVVRHRCDNPLCVNPWHLETGTRQDNIRDMVIRNRTCPGERNGMAKLTAEDALAIARDPRSNAAIGRSYGVDRTTVRNIKRGENWSAITGIKPKNF